MNYKCKLELMQSNDKENLWKFSEPLYSYFTDRCSTYQNDNRAKTCLASIVACGSILLFSHSLLGSNESVSCGIGTCS